MNFQRIDHLDSNPPYQSRCGTYSFSDGATRLPVCPSALGAEPKQVLLLHSFGREVKPWSDYAQSIHSELERQSPWPLAITDHSLVSARSSDGDPEVPFVEYLHALFSKHPPDLIVSVGAPAAAFVQRHRQHLFATTPMVLSVVEQRHVDYSTLTANDAVVPVRINHFAVTANILHVLPDTKNVAVVVGTSPIEQFWREEIRKDLMPLTDRITFTFWDNLPFEGILKHAAALPPHSAILWEAMIVDVAGVVHDGDTAFFVGFRVCHIHLQFGRGIPQRRRDEQGEVPRCRRSTRGYFRGGVGASADECRFHVSDHIYDRPR
jgi:hypothetical protein